MELKPPHSPFLPGSIFLAKALAYSFCFETPHPWHHLLCPHSPFICSPKAGRLPNSKLVFGLFEDERVWRCRWSLLWASFTWQERSGAFSKAGEGKEQLSAQAMGGAVPSLVSMAIAWEFSCLFLLLSRSVWVFLTQLRIGEWEVWKWKGNSYTRPLARIGYMICGSQCKRKIWGSLFKRQGESALKGGKIN